MPWLRGQVRAIELCGQTFDSACACLTHSRCSTGCTWRLIARLALHGKRMWTITVTGAHGKRREALVYKSRNPLIKSFLLQRSKMLTDMGLPPAYRDIVEKPPVGISTAEQARCYVTAAQASSLMRNVRYQEKKRSTRSTGRHGRLVIDPSTTLSDAFMEAARAPGGE